MPTSLALLLLVMLRSLHAADGACSLCPGGRLLGQTQVQFDEKIRQPTMSCVTIQDWLTDEDCSAAQVRYNSSCCDFEPAGVPTLLIGEWSIGWYSVYTGYHVHLFQYVVLVAFNHGFLERLIPNWRDFKIEFESFGHDFVIAYEGGEVWLNKALPHCMYQALPEDGTRPVQMSAAVASRYTDAACLRIASGLGVFGVPVVGNLATAALNNQQMYPTFIRSGVTNEASVFGIVNLYVLFGIFKVSVISALDSRVTTDGFRKRMYEKNEESATIYYPWPLESSNTGDSIDSGVTLANSWDTVEEWADGIARSEPRAFVIFTYYMWTAVYWRAFIEIGFVGPQFLWTITDAMNHHFGSDKVGGGIPIKQWIEVDPNVAEFYDSFDFDKMGDYMQGTIGPVLLFGGEGLTDDNIGIPWNDFFQNHITLDMVYELGVLHLNDAMWDEDSTTFYKRSPHHYISLFFQPETMTFKEYFLPEFDGVVALFIAIGKLVAEGKKQHEIRGATLLNAIMESDFHGVSGRFSLKSGVRQVPMSFSQLMPYVEGVRYLTSARTLQTDFAFFRILKWDPNIETWTYPGEADEQLPGDHPYRLWPMRFADGTSNPPSDTRLPCDAGSEYIDHVYGCVSCPRGRYSPVAASQCINCEAGFIAEESSSLQCVMCGAGSYSKPFKYHCEVCESKGVCVTCASVDDCNPCAHNISGPDVLLVPIPYQADGPWEMSSGASKCDACDKGSHSASRGTPECSMCSAGTFAVATGATACDGCATDFYSEGLGSTSCQKCPGDMTTIETSSQSILDCVCRQGTYYPCEGADNARCNIGNSTPDEAFCSPCPQGADCSGPARNPTAMFLGERHRPPKVAPNNMAIGTDVYKCTIKTDAITKCRGGFMGIEEMCEEGSFGLACAECGIGNYFNGFTCVPCEGSTGAWIGLAVVLILLLFAYLTITSFPAEPNGTFSVETIHKKRIRAALNVIVGLGFSLAQFSWMFTKMNSVEFDPGLYDILSDGGDFFFEADLINTPCTLSVGSTREAAVVHTAVLNVLPLFVLLISGILIAVGMMPQAKGRSKWPNKYDAVSNLLVMFSTFFMIIANSSINTGFATFDHPNGESSLVAYPNVLTTSDEAGAMRVICIFGILLWCVGGLAIVLWATWQLPRRTQDMGFRRCTLALQLKYQPHAPWWFTGLLLQKLLIALSLTLFSTSAWQGVFVCAVYIIYLALFISFRPTYAPVCFYCEILSTIGILTLFLTVWGIRPKDGGEGLQACFALITYFQFALFLVLGLVVTIRNEVFSQRTNIADLMKDVGGRMNNKTGFGSLETLESRYVAEAQKNGKADDGSDGKQQDQNWANATV